MDPKESTLVPTNEHAQPQLVDVRGLPSAKVTTGPAGGKWLSLVLVKKSDFDAVVYRGDPSSLPANPDAYKGFKFFLMEGDLLPTATIEGSQYYLLTKELVDYAGVSNTGAFLVPVNHFGTMFEPGMIPVQENAVGWSDYGLILSVIGLAFAVLGIYFALKKKD